MKAYAIVIQNNEISETAFRKLKSSTKMRIDVFDAIPLDEVDRYMGIFNLKWTYPWDEERLDITSGLRLLPYTTKNRRARISCAISHYLLWRMALVINEPILILEHDAIFNDENPLELPKCLSDIVGINDPRGATRKSQIYHERLQASQGLYPLVPWVDDDRMIPQGLAGNSAYSITPDGARELISLVETHGLWPNDAIMCKQLIPDLATSKHYFTRVQGTPSTTSL